MHSPNFYLETRGPLLHRMMATHPLAAVVTLCGSSLVASHIPMVHEDDGSEFGVLRGHVSRANMQERCGAAIAGRFGQFGRPFGARRIPVSLQGTVSRRRELPGGPQARPASSDLKTGLSTKPILAQSRWVESRRPLPRGHQIIRQWPLEERMRPRRIRSVAWRSLSAPPLLTPLQAEAFSTPRQAACHRGRRRPAGEDGHARR